MTQFANAMEVFKLLDQSNCRKCNEQTCIAFASKVFLGQKSLELCPSLDEEILKQYTTVNQMDKTSISQDHKDELLISLQNEIKSCNLEHAAQRVGGEYSNKRLTIRIFGKPLSIDSTGKMFSDIHINPWITNPVLEYILRCKGVPLTGDWVTFRELEGGREKNGLFVQRSEKSLKQIADKYTDFFEDLILIFNGKKIKSPHESDISLVLYPLPKIPILICYWKPEDNMASDLHLFFDSSADMNGNIDIVYGIAAGIVVMFEKISTKHGVNTIQA